jgi:phage internal scaffolding protein
VKPERKRVAHPRDPAEGSLTQGEFTKDADINTIVARSLRTGSPLSSGTRVSSAQPIYMDLSSVDYLESLNKVQDMRVVFDSLPSRTRMRFNNDPHQLIRFVENPDNRKLAQKLGLIPEDVQDKDVLDLREELEAEAAAREAAAGKADDEAQPSFGKDRNPT